VQAYFILLQSVESQPGLIHGRLHNYKGEHCVLGTYFKQHPDWAIPTDLIDEVAAVNDSAPSVTPLRRKQIVEQYLKWKLRCFGFHYRAKKPARAINKAKTLSGGRK
jgi:hypothetical protein